MVMRQRAEREIYQLQAEICKALANPIRLEILDVVGEQEVSFGELMARLGISKTNLSQHLLVMRRAGIVLDRREGVYAYYHLAYPEVLQACRLLKALLQKRLKETGRLASALETQKGREKV